MVPMAGLEPARFWARDFKSLVSAISPHRRKVLKNHHLLLSYLNTTYLNVKLFLVGMEGVEPPCLSAIDFESITSAIPSHTQFCKMVVLSGNAPDSYASPAINCVISTAAFFKLQDHFNGCSGG